MERKKAIEILKDLADCNYIGSLAGEDREALEMAINSLKVDEAYNLLYEETTKKDLEVASECKLEDCIDREYTAKYVEEFANNEYVSEHEAKTIYLIAEGVRHIPAVYPKSDKPSGKWIRQMKSAIADSLEFWDYSPNNNPLARDILETVNKYCAKMVEEQGETE